jgi:hypothetical protein
MITPSREKITAMRLLKTGAWRQFNSAEDCVRSLWGIRSQLPQFAEVVLLNRCRPEQNLEDLAVCHEQNLLICSWSHRKTLHLHTVDDGYKICEAYSGLATSDETRIIGRAVKKNDRIAKEHPKQIVQNELRGRAG